MNPRRLSWLACAIVLFVVGTTGSFVAADSVARSAGRSSRLAFVESSKGIASTLDLAIQHEQDLATDAGAFFIANPDASQAQFAQWTKSVRAFSRYPELQGVAELALVPASQLSAFAARAEANPSGPIGPGGVFEVVPAGNRPYYCFVTVAEALPALLALPAGIDYCYGSLGPELLAVRDSGREAFLPSETGKGAELLVGSPIYQGGTVPGTVDARRATFVGWTGVEVLPNVVLDTAMRGHPGTKVVFRYTSGSLAASFEAGTARTGAQSTTITLSEGWRVQVFASVPGDGIAANWSALVLLLAGVVVSLSLAVQLFVLGTSRSRALELVRERTDELEYQAFHDSLTGLPNRALILDRAGQMLARARRERTPAAALFLDLDDFKDINDTLGHNAGDQLLVAVAARLEGALREGDSVGRLGGDEFVILTGSSSIADGAGRLAERILEVMEEPFEIADSDSPLAVNVSIGIAEGERIRAEDLLRDADIALYQAKAAGKKCAVVFSASMQDTVNQHRHLEVDLHHAVANGEFFMLYQPTVDLSTGVCTGVEALLRWHHPLRGVVMPEDFVPALETSGLIVPVGLWALDAACRQGAAWQSRGHRITVSVNVSAVQLERDQIVVDVQSALEASGFDPGLLILELTETALMRDVEATLVRLTDLKALGVGIAVDDFGMGYSSLSYLRQFPIDVLKIDQSFVSGMTGPAGSMAIVHTLVQLGKLLGLRTVAEGIETDEQVVRLRAEQVDLGQGFLFARPLDASEVLRFLTGPPHSIEDLRVLL
ncbi:MAG: EAL domain-containing protein [Acidimicrobiales bacterium]